MRGDDDAAGQALARSAALAEEGELDAALAAAEEAIALLRRSSACTDPSRTPELARALVHLVGLLAAHGRLDEALAAADEAVALARCGTEHDPGFVPVLAGALAIRALCFVAVGRLREALGAVGEATDLYRTPALPASAELAAGCAGALGLAAWLHHGAGEDRRAAACAAEGLRVLLAAFAELPIDHAQLLVQLARIHLDACTAAGDEPDAELLRHVREALERRAGELASRPGPAQHGADP